MVYVVTTRADLDELGFLGFVPFSELPESGVPEGGGVYAVLRVASAPPAFLDESAAGRHKGRNPTVSIEKLDSAWVPGVEVVYIGKATPGAAGRRGLRKRLDEYRRHGAGERVGHWGGRYVWQLADAEKLLVAWLPTPGQDASEVEGKLIALFLEQVGRLPFANLKRERVT